MMNAAVPLSVPRATSEHLGIACVDCHREEKGSGKEAHLFAAILSSEGEVRGEGCLSCHEDFNPEEVDRFIRTSREEITGILRGIQERRQDAAGEAEEALRLIEQDGSLGFHNEVLTRFLLQQVKEGLHKTGKEDRS
jgi:hypothetical protein